MSAKAKVILTEILADGSTDVPAEVLDALEIDAHGSLAWMIRSSGISVGAGDVPCPADTPADFWGGIADALTDIWAERLVLECDLVSLCAWGGPRG